MNLGQQTADNIKILNQILPFYEDLSFKDQSNI